MKEKEIKVAALKFCINGASFEVERERRRKKIICDTKPIAKLIHASHHYVEGAEIF